jgi:uncharacterized protein (DUF1499 family)
MRFLPRRRWATVLTLAGLGLAGLLLLLFAISAVMGRSYPPINDITTDFERPPEYWVKPPELGAYNAEKFRAKTEAAYGDVRNLALPITPDAAYARVLTLVKARGWTVAAQDEAGKRIQAIAITRLMRFRDDVIVEVRPGPGPAQSVIAMRSKSRLGIGDLGANAKRIRAFFADLQKP